MKLTRIELEDFRCFGKAELDLRAPGGEKPLSVALLVGPNGAGKSSVIAAIGGFFQTIGSAYLGRNWKADALNIEDIRSGRNMARLRVDWIDRVQDSQEPFFHEVIIRRHLMTVDGKSIEAGVDPALLKFLGHHANWVSAMADTARREAGLIVSFDVYRLLPPQAIAGPNVKEVVSHRIEGAMQPTVNREGRLNTRFEQLKQWIVNMDFQRAKAKADRNTDSPDWEIMRHALDSMFNPYRFERVDERFDVLFRTPTGLVPLEALSDGFRSMFVIVTELLFRLSLTTDDPGRILGQEAVCVIDEIDAHLHPKWQERVLPALRTLFPNVQFIATTHSPFVVSTAAPHEVFRLEETEEE